MNQPCESCFSEQRSLNDLFQQAIFDAQKLADKENKKVAVFAEGQKWQFRVIEGQLPGGTCYVAKPV